MFSYLVIFAGVLAISVSFPQDFDDRIGFPDDEELQGINNWQQNWPQRQRPQRPNSRPNFNTFPPITSGPSSTTVNVPLQSTTPATVTIQSPAFRQCLANMCPTTNEYNPVCGSDNVNYNNHQKLNCTNFCGPRVDPNWQPIAQIRIGTCNPL